MVLDAALRGTALPTLSLFSITSSDYVVLTYFPQSLTQTRLHFQNIVAGFTDEDEAAIVDWKEDLTPRGEVTKREKGKERVSDVGAGAGGGAVASVTGSGSGSASAKKKRKNDGRVVS